MKRLIEIIREAESKKIAIGHFNISELIGLKSVFEAALEISKYQNTQLPIIIGVSEGERNFIGPKQIAALIKSLREEFDYPIFLNADHTKSLEKIKEAVEAGFDAVMFDGSQLPLEENTKKTKEIVSYVKNSNPEILVEAELGYIRGVSTLLTTPDAVNNIKEEDLTKPEEASQFVKETGVDLLAPAVGNIHGILVKEKTLINNISINQQNHYQSALIAAENPPLDIQRVKDIKKNVNVPLVLHGGSGISDENILAAIDAGVSIVHINTELRLAWRRGLERAFQEKPDEIVPYKLLPRVVEEIKRVADQKLRVFNRLV